MIKLRAATTSGKAWALKWLTIALDRLIGVVVVDAGPLLE